MIVEKNESEHIAVHFFVKKNSHPKYILEVKVLFLYLSIV